jgi:hypothetical protein
MPPPRYLTYPCKQIGPHQRLDQASLRQPKTRLQQVRACYCHCLKAYSLYLGTSFDNESTQAAFDSSTESENLGSDSLSVYDCDSEGGGGWSDAESEDSGGDTKGTHKPGTMGLKFQLDAARSGKLHHFLMDMQQLTELHSPEIYQ